MKKSPMVSRLTSPDALYKIGRYGGVEVSFIPINLFLECIGIIRAMEMNLVNLFGCTSVPKELQSLRWSDIEKFRKINPN